jgi:ArsR family transcriptional regulator
MTNEVREQAVVQANYCKVFGNVQRVLIFWSLVYGELSVGEIATLVNGSLQNTSQHLHLMKNKGILTSRRDGQTIYYRIVENDLMKDCLLVKRAHQQMETSREENK